jgi:hypothetical protein
MGIRRRRRKLSTLMSRLDQRVRSVELRPVSLLTSDQINDAIDSGELLSPPESFVGSSAPNQFYKIEDAYIYPKSLGLPEDRVEIYLEVDLNVVKGEILEISGIHGTQNHDIDVDGESFVVKSLDTPPWDGRGLPNNTTKDDPTNDQRPGVSITNAYSITPETQAPQNWNTFYRLQTKRAVDSYHIVGTTVTLTTNSTHKFKAGDVVFVDIFAQDSRAFGIDGLFEIDSVTSNTIVYTLDAGIDEPEDPIEVEPLSLYVFPVARKFASVGSTWTNTSDNTIYYWDGIRWVTWSAGSVEPDDDPPAAPTNLEITSEGVVSTNVSLPTASVTLTWTAPTLNESGSPLTDLIGYKIKWRRTPNEGWKIKDIPIKNATSYTFDGDAIFLQGTLYYFELYAYDSGGLDSSPATGTHTTAIKTTPLSAASPTDPIIESRLGTMTVKWNGLLATTPPTNPPSDVLYLKIHRSLVDNFTPSDSTLVATISAVANNYSVFSDLTYGSDYYFKFVLIDTSGVQSQPSAQVTARVTPLVDVDLLVSNVLNSWSFAGNLISAGDLADGTINASTLFGPNVIVQSAIAANAIGADQIAAGSIIAGKIGANAITANVIAANSISAGAIEANAIKADKIDVGALDGKIITGSTVRTSGNNPRVEMNSTGLYAFNSAGGVTFRVLSSDGSVFIASGVQIGGYAQTSDLAGYLTAGDLSGYATTGSLNSKLSTDADLIAIINDSTAVTRIEGGKIKTGTIDANLLVSNFILSQKIVVGAPETSNTSNPGRIELRGTGIDNPGIVAFKNGGAGTQNSTFRMYTANGYTAFRDTFIDGDLTISAGGDLKLSGTGKITAGTTVITSGLVSGGVVRTSSGTWGRVNLSSVTNTTYGQAGALNFETSNTFIRGGAFPTSSTSVALGSYAVGGTNAGGSFAYIWNVDGGIRNTSATSDIRLKEHVEDLGLGLDVVNSLRPVKFVWKQDHHNKKQWGFIAQEARPIFESHGVDLENNPITFTDSQRLVDGESGKEPSLTFKDNKLVPVLVQAIKDLSAQVEQLTSRIEYLENN